MKSCAYCHKSLSPEQVLYQVGKPQYLRSCLDCAIDRPRLRQGRRYTITADLLERLRDGILYPDQHEAPGEYDPS